MSKKEKLKKNYRTKLIVFPCHLCPWAWWARGVRGRPWPSRHTGARDAPRRDSAKSNWKGYRCRCIERFSARNRAPPTRSKAARKSGLTRVTNPCISGQSKEWRTCPFRVFRFVTLGEFLRIVLVERIQRRLDTARAQELFARIFSRTEQSDQSLSDFEPLLRSHCRPARRRVQHVDHGPDSTVFLHRLRFLFCHLKMPKSKCETNSVI